MSAMGVFRFSFSRFRCFVFVASVGTPIFGRCVSVSFRPATGLNTWERKSLSRLGLAWQRHFLPNTKMLEDPSTTERQCAARPDAVSTCVLTLPWQGNTCRRHSRRRVRRPRVKTRVAGIHWAVYSRHRLGKARRREGGSESGL